jgi:hypothetical protein
MKRMIVVGTAMVVALIAGTVAAQMQRRGESSALTEAADDSMVVSGDERPDVFRALSPEIAKRHSGH